MMSATTPEKAAADDIDNPRAETASPATEGQKDSASHDSPKQKTEGKKKRKRSKKAKGAPRRPLSAYNAFFKEQREIILKERDESAKSGQQQESGGDLFSSMGRKIAKAWKELTPERMKKYKKIAETDMKRYQAEMEEYRLLQALQKVEGRKHTKATSDEEGDSKPAAAAVAGAAFGTPQVSNSTMMPSGLTFTSPLMNALRQEQYQADSTTALVREARVAAQRLREDVQARQSLLNRTSSDERFASAAAAAAAAAGASDMDFQRPVQLGALPQQQQQVPQQQPAQMSLANTKAQYLQFLQEQDQLRALQDRRAALERERMAIEQKQQQIELQRRLASIRATSSVGVTRQPQQHLNLDDAAIAEFLRRRELEAQLRASQQQPQQVVAQGSQMNVGGHVLQSDQQNISILDILRREQQLAQLQQEENALMLHHHQQEHLRRSSDQNNRDPSSRGGF